MTISINPGPTIPEWPHQRPSGKMYLATPQLNLVSDIWTPVELDTISANFNDGIEDITNHKITPGHAGFYDAKGLVMFSSVVANMYYGLIIRLNGTDNIISTYSHSSLAEYLSVICSAHVYLSATDYLDLIAAAFTGVNTVDIRAGEDRTFLSVQRVR